MSRAKWKNLISATIFAVHWIAEVKSRDVLSLATSFLIIEFASHPAQSEPMMNMGDMPSMNMNAPTAPAASGRIEFNENKPAGYTLPDIQKLASKYNPTLIQAQAQIKGEKGKAWQAGLPPNPDLAFAGDLLGVRRAGMGEFMGGLAQQEIVLGGKLKYSRRKYDARVQAAIEQARAQQFRVMNDVQIAFYHTLAASEIVKLEKELLKSTQDMWLTTREMFNVGQANQTQLHQTNIAIEEQRIKVMAAQNDLQMHWQELTALAGIDEEYRDLNGTLELGEPDIDFQATLSKLLAESPELAEAKEKLKADELTVKREHKQRVPNLLLAGGPGYDQIDKSVAVMATASLTNLPVWNRNQGTIQQAEADLARQKAQVRLVELTLKTRFAKVYARYITAKQHVEAYKNTIVPEARKKYELDLESYRDDRTDWTSVLSAQREYFSNRVQYIQYLLALKESSVQLQGFVLTGGLTPPPGVTPPGHIDATPQPR